MSSLVSFPVVTIFAREFLEGAIIIGEYRTIVLRGDSLSPDVRKEDALREVTLSSLFAFALAFLVIAAVAIPLAVLSMSFDNTTSKTIEGISKIVAGVSLLLLSLKLPTFLGIYGGTTEECITSRATENHLDSAAPDGTSSEAVNGSSQRRDYLTLRSIRFNVAWNIWREVAECGVFLIPYFLSGQGLIAIPLSAVIGSAVGLAVGYGIYVANKRCKSKKNLAIFAILLLSFLSAGLFTGGCHNLESVLGSTPLVWEIRASFWSIDRLPMTLLKPFGYNDSRTVLEIVCFWSWLALTSVLHYRKYRNEAKTNGDDAQHASDGILSDSVHSKSLIDTAELGDSSLEGDSTPYESSLNGDLVKPTFTIDDHQTDGDAVCALHDAHDALAADICGKVERHIDLELSLPCANSSTVGTSPVEVVEL